MFTDTEIGMAMSHSRSMRAFSNDAQGLVNEMDRDIVTLRNKLAAALDALADERALRLATELKLSRLNRLLDTPLN